MRWSLRICILVCALFPCVVSAAVKAHVITLGAWTSVQWRAGTGAEDEKTLNMKIRSLLVDGRVRESVFGPTHDATERLFVVRRAFRVNDSLPSEPAPHWQWQRGGWVLVDRTTGHVTSINLPEFDALYSAANWYRDYVAYCGVADDGKKTLAVVAQIGRRKPVLRKVLSETGVPDDAAIESACPAPVWQKSPVRVSFEAPGGAKQTFAVRGHVVDVVAEDEDEEGR